MEADTEESMAQELAQAHSSTTKSSAKRGGKEKRLEGKEIEKMSAKQLRQELKKRKADEHTEWRNRPNEPQESLAELVIRASRCCLAMLAKHSNFKPRTTDGAVLEGIVLKLHMGVGAGRISSFIVGGHGPSLDEKKWEYFIAGEPIQQAPRLPLLPPNPPT